MIDRIIRRVIGITLFLTVSDIVSFIYFDNELSVTRYILNMLFMSSWIIYIIAGYKQEERKFISNTIRRYSIINSDKVLRSIFRKAKITTNQGDKEKLGIEYIKRHIYLMQQYDASKQ